ncbi:MAG: ATP cone domain-containing protein, partial [Elusimicrobiota bacterium]
MNEIFPKVIKKRDGKVAPFNIEKIKTAIYKAAYTLGGRDEEKAVEVANEVARRLNNNFTIHKKIPTVDDSNAVCVEVLREKGFDRTADKFESYSLDRSRVRKSGLNVKKNARADITDQMLLVQSITNETIEPFDRKKLADALEKEYQLSRELAEMIAKETENDSYELSDKYGTNNFDTQFLRRISEAHLSMMGIPLKNSALAMPLSTIESLVIGNS